jgi:hypothetical protein
MSTPGAARAHQAVHQAIKDGGLPRISDGMKCVDCGAQAEAYDHRDYNKPLDVELVCHPCNSRRGQAIADESSCTQERFQMYIPEPLLKALRALAKKTDTSVAEHIRRAITEYLRKESK